MNDLDTMRPEVREAIEYLHDAATLGNGTPLDEAAHVRTLCAELLRLVDENKRMRGIIETLDIEGHRRAEKAEAELAALKARIADAPMGVTRVCPYVVCIDIEGDEPYLIAAGKNVRLVVED